MGYKPNMASKFYKFSLFSGISTAQVDRLTEKFRSRRFKKGENLCTQGAKTGPVVLLVEGRVGVQAETSSGRKTIFIFHDAPYIFGHLEVWDNKPVIANVVAMESCSALILSREEYLQLLQSNHQLAVNMVKMLSKLIRHTSEDQYVRMFGQVEDRVANTLCAMARLYGEERSDGILIRKELSKTELASILGIARRTVIRAFQTLEDEGLVIVTGKEWLLPDIIALQHKFSMTHKESETPRV